MGVAFPNKVLLATDGSEDAIRATDAALDLCEKGAELHVVHAWRAVPSVHFDAFVRREMHQMARELLEAEVGRIEAAGGTVTEAYLREGSPVDEVLDLADELDANLVIVGGKGRGPIGRLLMGSVSEGIVHAASRPVLVMRGPEGVWPPARVIVGDDGSEDALRAAMMAGEISRTGEATALLVSASPRLPKTDEEGRRLNPRLVDDELHRSERRILERAEELQAAFGDRPKVRLVAGEPTSALLEAAHENGPPPLIALGRRGLHRARRIRLGSVSTKVLRAAEGPVLIHPHPRDG